MSGRSAKPSNSRPPVPTTHRLECWEVDDLDEIDDDAQLALLRCATCKAWEWHYVPRELLRTDEIFITAGKPL